MLVKLFQLGTPITCTSAATSVLLRGGGLRLRPPLLATCNAMVNPRNKRKQLVSYVDRFAMFVVIFSDLLRTKEARHRLG